MVLVYALLGLARLVVQIIQRSRAERCNARQHVLTDCQSEEQSVKSLALLAFPRLELTMLLLCTPALAAAGAGKALLIRSNVTGFLGGATQEQQMLLIQF